MLVRVFQELVYHNDLKIQSRNQLEQFSRVTPPVKSGAPAPVSLQNSLIQLLFDFLQGLEGLLDFSTSIEYTESNAGGVSNSPLAVDYYPQLEEMDSRPVLSRSASQRESSSRAEPRVLTRDPPTMDKLGLASLKRRN